MAKELVPRWFCLCAQQKPGRDRADHVLCDPEACKALREKRAA